ncbi:MAG: hypothetical protein Q4G13_04665 [Moraxella sp.]|nr:hypothetical protein [Moraxella sp.]
MNDYHKMKLVNGSNFWADDYLYYQFTQQKFPLDISFAFMDLIYPKFIVYQDRLFLYDKFYSERTQTMLKDILNKKKFS